MPNGADPRIARIQPLRPRGLKVLLHLEPGEPLEITLEALERSRLGVGDTLSPTQRHHLLSADADVRVRDAALHLVSYRARTRSELARRLRQKGFAPARIAPCLDRLADRGLIDDEAVAAAFVRDRLRHRPRGRSRLASELRAKGLSGTLASDTIDRVFADAATDDLALALDVAERWVARQGPDTLDTLAEDGTSPARERVRRRLVAHLARRGFSGDALRAGTARAETIARTGPEPRPER